MLLWAHVDVVIRPPSSAVFARMMDYIRSKRFGIKTYGTREALWHLFRVRHTVRAYCFAGDQCPQKDDAKHWASFFGHETAFFQGLERVPRLLNAPVFFLHIKQTRRGYYHITPQLIAAPPYAPYDARALAILPAYCRALEASIQAAPKCWLWSHKRWKYTRAHEGLEKTCLLYTSPSPRDRQKSRMPSSA